jgi:hypothetical protein
MPSWDVTLNLPVVTEEYTFSDMAESEEFLEVVGDSMEIRVEESIAALHFGGRLNLESHTEEFGLGLDDLEIDPISEGNLAFVLGELWDEAYGQSDTLTVPPFFFPLEGDSIMRTVDLGETLEWVEVESGTLEIDIHNGLPVVLGHEAAGCPLKLVVRCGDDYCDSCVAGGPLDPGEDGTYLLDLAGRRISRTVSVSISGGSPGSEGEVGFSAYDEVNLCVRPIQVRASRALADVPPQAFSEIRSVEIEDSTRVVEADIESGVLEFTLANDLPVDVNLDIQCPDLTAGGEPLAVSCGVGPFSEQVVGVDLGGYVLSTGTVPGEPFMGTNEMEFEVTGSTAQGSMVEISAGDLVRVEAALRDLRFDRVMGTVKDTRIEFDEEHDLEFPTGFEHVDPLHARLVILIENSAMVGGDFRLDIEGVRDGDTESATFEGEIAPAESRGGSRLTRCEYSDQDTRDLIGLFPETIGIDGEATVWGEGTIFSTDSLRGRVEIAVPLTFRVEADTFTTEPRYNEIARSVRDNLENGIREAGFAGRVLTDAPLGGGLRMFFAGDSTEVFTDPLLTLPTDGSFVEFTGMGTGGPPEFAFRLSEQDLEVFLGPGIWFGLEVRLSPTGDYVTLLPENSISVEGRIELTRRIES